MKLIYGTSHQYDMDMAPGLRATRPLPQKRLLISLLVKVNLLLLHLLLMDSPEYLNHRRKMRLPCKSGS